MDSKYRIAIIIGLCSALGGTILAYRANWLHSSLDDLFQTIGLMILCFGLLLILLAFYSWLRDSKA